MPLYAFRLPAAFSSTPVTVYNSADVQQTTGTTDANAVFTATLPTGDYYAKVSYGYTSYRAAGEVDRGDQDNISEAALAPTPTSSQPTDSRPLWLSNNVKDLRVSAAPSDRSTVLAPTLSWEGTAVQEPSVFYANGVYNMLYTGNVSTNAGIGWATAPT